MCAEPETFDDLQERECRKPETVSKLHHGCAQRLRISHHPGSLCGPPRRRQSLGIVPWIGAEPETVVEFMLWVVVKPETVVEFMVWVG